MSYIILYYLFGIILIFIVLFYLAVFIYYVRIEKFADIDYTNIYNIDWGDCEVGQFLGTELTNDTTCSSVCGIGDFKIVFLSEKQATEMSSKKIKYHEGYWCFPESVSKCNLDINHLLVGENEKIYCVGKHPQLFEQNKIIGCNPNNTIQDRLTNEMYVKYIPTNLNIQDLDEVLPDGTYRWVCVNDSKTVSPVDRNRFLTIHNRCNLLTGQNLNNGPKFINGDFKCDCDYYANGDANSICTNCVSGYGVVDAHLPQPGSEFAHSIGVDCVDPDTHNNSMSRLAKMPCGVSTLTRIRKNGMETACMRAMVDATNTYSPEVLAKLKGRANLGG